MLWILFNLQQKSTRCGTVQRALLRLLRLLLLILHSVSPFAARRGVLELDGWSFATAAHNEHNIEYRHGRAGINHTRMGPNGMDGWVGRGSHIGTVWAVGRDGERSSCCGACLQSSTGNNIRNASLAPLPPSVGKGNGQGPIGVLSSWSTVRGRVATVKSFSILSSSSTSSPPFSSHSNRLWDRNLLLLRCSSMWRRSPPWLYCALAPGLNDRKAPATLSTSPGSIVRGLDDIDALDALSH